MIPNLFHKMPMPNNIPESMQAKIKEYSRNKNKEEFLRKAFHHIINMYKPGRINTFLKFSELYKTDIDYLWNHKGYFHCTSLNYILRIMMIKSNLFKDSDIILCNTTTYYIIPHQYLRININKQKSLDIDLYTYPYGIPYGDHGHGFHAGSINPKSE